MARKRKISRKSMVHILKKHLDVAVHNNYYMLPLKKYKVETYKCLLIKYADNKYFNKHFNKQNEKVYVRSSTEAS